jgi:hypothetical protein
MTSRLRDATWLGIRSGVTGRPTGHHHLGDGHVHDHGHAHGGHHHGASGETTPELALSPLLDIGGDTGAMVVYLAGPTRSGELEAHPADRPGARFHTGVHLRDVGADAPEWVAVFPDVRSGDYSLLDDHGEPFAAVVVTGGQVSEVDLRDAALRRR